jgi:acetyltransferase-like isoleucine patch superfamily enzyme
MPSFRGAWLRAGSYVTTFRLSRAGVIIGGDVYFIGKPIVSVTPGSRISLGARTVLASKSEMTALGVNHPVVLRTMQPDARLEIGSDVGISGGTICAAFRVSIGDGCLIGANATIVDTNFHPIASRDRRYAPPPEPNPEDGIIIGRNVFIGTGAIILPGTNIGDDAAIGAGAVVKGQIGTGMSVAGNPAKELRAITFLPRPG